MGRTLTKASLVKGGHEDSTADYVVSTLQAAKGRGYRVDAESASGGRLVPTVAATVKAHRGKGGGGLSIEETLLPQIAHTLRAEGFDASEDGTGRGTPLTVAGVGVRRLTPTECCRLQGFPDDWFGEPNERPDGPRYAALGDAVTVTVAEWLGERIAAEQAELRDAA